MVGMSDCATPARPMPGEDAMIKNPPPGLSVMLMVVVVVVSWSLLGVLRHPYGLHDLEYGRPDDDEDEERDELGRDRVAVVLLGALADVAALRDVLGVLLVGLSHARRRRHLGGEVGRSGGGQRMRSSLKRSTRCGRSVD